MVVRVLGEESVGCRGISRSEVANSLMRKWFFFVWVSLARVDRAPGTSGIGCGLKVVTVAGESWNSTSASSK